jgi:transposase
LGIYTEDKSFEYAMKLGEFASKNYLEVMNWQAEKAKILWEKTQKITVIVVDNYRIHKSEEVKKYQEEWQRQGLEIFFLSTYSPKLNLIKTEWHQLKTHELSGRMFEDEYDLAMTVIVGIEAR